MLLSVECAGRVRRRPRPGRAGRARRWGSERLPRIDCPGMGWVAIGIAAGASGRSPRAPCCTPSLSRARLSLYVPFHALILN